MVSLAKAFERISVEKISRSDLKEILGDDWSPDMAEGVGVWDKLDNRWLTVFAVVDGEIKEFEWD